MPLSLPLEELLRAGKERRAIAAFSIYNLEQALAVNAAAEEQQEAVLLQAGSSAFAYAGREPLAALALAVAQTSSASVGVHLDHATDIDEIHACLQLGYTSVMFDGSALPVDDNIRITAAIIAEAHSAGAWVEAELAGISGDEDSSLDAVSEGRVMTDPEVAARFVERTGVDALAVAIGNVHGIPATPVRLDLERLAAIRERVAIPLVLHGASGLLDEDVQAAIGLGVVKINVNTELRRALRESLANSPPSDRDDVASILGASRTAMQAVAESKIELYSNPPGREASSHR